MCRIITYNIHSGVGRDKKHDYKRIGQFLANSGADVVLLQEMDTRPPERDTAQDVKDSQDPKASLKGVRSGLAVGRLKVACRTLKSIRRKCLLHGSDQADNSINVSRTCSILQTNCIILASLQTIINVTTRGLNSPSMLLPNWKPWKKPIR